MSVQYFDYNDNYFPYKQLLGKFVPNLSIIDLFLCNCHRGCMHWPPTLHSVQNYADIAAAVQRIYEEIFEGLIRYTEYLTNGRKKNLVLTGGCVLNCVANRIAHKHFDNVWIMPNPGDAGSSLGSAAYVYGDKINFEQCFIGHEIKGRYPTKKVLDELLAGNIVGVASGKAEYGPRALGNRSLLADPRGNEIKDKVNVIK